MRRVMYIQAVFDRFVQKSPVTVMTRALLERALAPEALNRMFGTHAEWQYERKLLFSSVVDLMGMVVCKIQPSIKAAYEAVEDTLPVSLSAVYNKLDGIEGDVTRALVCHVAAQLGPVIEAMGGQHPPLLPGHRVRIIDGNQLTSTDRRLAVLRDTKAGARPGQSLVVLDPALMLAVDMIPCEDAYAQERSLLSQVLSRVMPGEVWIADRNFCTVMFLQGILERKSHFVIRQHGRFPIASYGTLRARGRCNSGRVFEQAVTFPGADGAAVKLRRVVVHLDAPTEDGDLEIAILTDLSARKASAAKIADMYRERWTVEGLFLTLTQTLTGEVPSLGYPKAALFAFGVALVSYNVASVVRAALRTQFGREKVEQEVSWYYIANEVRVVSGGMDVALEDAVWEPFQRMPAEELAAKLIGYAGNVRLAKFKKHPRGPKKTTSPPTNPTGKAHVSTARLLAQAGHRM